MSFIVLLVFYPVLVLLIYKFYVLKRFYPPQNTTEIIFTSNNFIIINKGPDFKINSNNKTEKTVQTFLKSKYPNIANASLYHEFYFPHRLDYATSGILCIPKTKKACRTVSEAFASRTTRKYYIALVYGLLSQDLIDVNISIGEDIRKKETQKMCTSKDDAFCKEPRIARTLIAPLEEGLYNNYPTTKVLCRLVTGRRHQIRVHCSYLGHTIVGDYTYSNGKGMEPSRMYLHASRLVLPNSVENLDIWTGDPFIAMTSWRKTKTIYSIDVAYEKLDNFYNKLCI